MPSSSLGSRAILKGDALWKALGFKNKRAFQRARQKRQLDVPFYPNPDDRGVHAYVDDVQRYLDQQSANTPAQQAPLPKGEGNK